MSDEGILIIGGGIAGAATAWHLSAHYSVLLLEQGDAPGQEATAQNAGMVRRMGEDPTERSLAFRTVEFLENLPGDFHQETSKKTGAIVALVRDPHRDGGGDAAALVLGCSRARGVRGAGYGEIFTHYSMAVRGQA